MTALPMTLEEALRHQGFTIELAEVAAFVITTDLGEISVPAAVRSVLTWGRPGSPDLGDDLFLGKLPMFNEEYRPILLSSLLDNYRTRRLGYNTPGQFRLAVRRWGNLHMPLFNQRYASTAVLLPLDDHDETVAATQHALDTASDFPQSLISGGADYSTTANDRRVADNDRLTGRRRSISSLIMEQREAYLNVDLDVVTQFDELFLGIFDQAESDNQNMYAPPPRHWPVSIYDRPTFNW